MISKVKPLLERIVLMALAVGLGLGLAWSPLERATVQLGFLIVGGALLAYTFYLVFQLSKISVDGDFDSNWPDDPEENSATLEVKP